MGMSHVPREERVGWLCGIAGVVGLVWATFGHFLGPEGLPDSSLRILDGSPPATPVRWLD
jgi:hypothetical protein